MPSEAWYVLISAAIVVALAIWMRRLFVALAIWIRDILWPRLGSPREGRGIKTRTGPGSIRVDPVPGRQPGAIKEPVCASPRAASAGDAEIANSTIGDIRGVTIRPNQSDDAEYLVWYGTNRRPNNPEDAVEGYSTKRDSTTHYGTCRVFIPKSHKIGSTGSPWWKRILTMTDDRLRLLEVHGMAASDYWQNMKRHLATVDRDERDAVIFVHGYNVSFQDAALRAAQIGFDLSVKGIMAFFAWPSQGTFDAYPADEATIEASEDVIGDYMVEVAAQSGAAAVHVIAHSMGNRAVLRAVNRIAARAQRRIGTRFGQFILAAADVDADTFRGHCAAYSQVARRATLYVSARDLAVEASHWLHQFPRAGLMPPVLVAPGIDTINVTNVDLTMLGHGYVADARDVLGDMHDLIRHDSPPEQRFGLREARTEEGDRYWLIGA